jgi:hypothetical protein
VNEDDLREALRTTLTTSPPPPPMASAPVISAGRRAVRWRTATTGAAAAVAVVAASALVTGPVLGRGDGGSPGIAPAGVPSAAPTGGVPTPARTPAPDDTEPSWPAGPDGKPQQDATARSGPRYEQGKRLQEQLLAVVPAGWTAPQGTTVDGIPLRDHQAAVEEIEKDVWGYLASVAVAKDGGTGRLLVEVHTKGNGLPAEPCALAREFWGMGGDCRVVTVDGRKVGVAGRPGNDGGVDQWASYRHPDGIVVHVAQSRRDANAAGGRAPLTTLPLTADQLAALAVDQRFHLE